MGCRGIAGRFWSIIYMMKRHVISFEKQSIMEIIIKDELKFASAFHQESLQIVYGYMTKIVSFCDKNSP